MRCFPDTAHLPGGASLCPRQPPGPSVRCRRERAVRARRPCLCRGSQKPCVVPLVHADASVVLPNFRGSSFPPRSATGRPRPAPHIFSEGLWSSGSQSPGVLRPQTSNGLKLLGLCVSCEHGVTWGKPCSLTAPYVASQEETPVFKAVFSGNVGTF